MNYFMLLRRLPFLHASLNLPPGVHNSYRLLFSARSGKKQRPTSQEMEVGILFSKSRSLIGVVWALPSGTE
jgi:hypothetical protein